MPVPARARLAGRGRPAGGLHDRPRRRSSRRPGCARASACSSTAAPAASARRRSSSARAAGARVSPRRCAARSCASRSRRSGATAIAPRGLRRARPVRRDPRAGRRPEPGREPAGARDRRADRRDRRLGAGAKSELNLLALMGKRGTHPRLDAAGPPARGEGADGPPAGARGAARCSSGGELSVPVAETFPLDEVAEAYERFAAGGKLGKIVLTP